MKIGAHINRPRGLPKSPHSKLNPAHPCQPLAHLTKNQHYAVFTIEEAMLVGEGIGRNRTTITIINRYPHSPLLFAEAPDTHV